MYCFRSCRFWLDMFPSLAFSFNREPRPSENQRWADTIVLYLQDGRLDRTNYQRWSLLTFVQHPENCPCSHPGCVCTVEVVN